MRFCDGDLPGDGVGRPLDDVALPLDGVFLPLGGVVFLPLGGLDSEALENPFPEYGCGFGVWLLSDLIKLLEPYDGGGGALFLKPGGVFW